MDGNGWEKRERIESLLHGIVISILYKGYPESKGHGVTAKKKRSVQAILMAPCYWTNCRAQVHGDEGQSSTEMLITS